MPLESGTYIDDLVATDPTGADGISDGDGHIRLLKSVLQNSFPGISGAVTSTHTELNYLDGATGVTGTGNTVRATGPTFVAPVLGAANCTSINKLAITGPASSATLTIADGKTFTCSNTLTFTGTDSSSVAFGAGGTVAYTNSKLSAFAATTSAELRGVISDETGTGALVFAGGALGAATATSINGLTITTSTGTFTLTNGKTLSVANTLSFSGTDGTSLNINAVAVLDAGFYTPTLTNVSGITSSSVAANSFQYLRVGKVVTVSGACSVDSSALGVWFLDLSLPVAPTFADSADLSGVCIWEGSNGSAAYEVGRCYANVAGGKCSIAVYGVNSSAERTLTVHFTYYVG